jgi:hypothetical protein
MILVFAKYRFRFRTWQLTFSWWVFFICKTELQELLPGIINQLGELNSGFYQTQWLHQPIFLQVDLFSALV